MPPLGFGLKQLVSGVVNPLTIFGSALRLWLDASLGITLNGSNVSAWADQSGNGFDFSQASSSLQPPYLASGIGGLPTIDTRASASAVELVSAANASAILNGSAAYRAIVWTPLAAASQKTGGVSGVNWGDIMGAGDNCPYSDGNFYDLFFNSAQRAITGISGLLGSPMLYEVLSSSSTWTAYINGSQVATFASNTPQVPALPIGILGNSTEWWNGELSSIVALNALPTSGQRSQYASYVTSRWGFAA